MDKLHGALKEKRDYIPESDDERAKIADFLSENLGMEVFPRSIFAARGKLIYLAEDEHRKYILGVCIPPENRSTTVCGPACVMKTIEHSGDKLISINRDADWDGMADLQRWAPQFKAAPVGLKKSIGLGDRLGLATPGHVRAIRATGGKVVPFLAQQSIREMKRTGRSPREVMLDAVFGALKEGWHGGFGSDADHLKEPEQVNACADAGFTMFTVDPGDHVDNDADTEDISSLREKYDTLPWHALETSPEEMRKAYETASLDLGKAGKVKFSEESFLRAAVKYGRAVAHTARMHRHITSRMESNPFELEMSVDETETATTVHEHYFIASELRRLEVDYVSLAPRFVGRFEKGVDFIGDIDELERTLTGHIAVTEKFGPYKLSVHSGSDKFTVYPLLAKHAGELVHVKTAGTSYLEAIRAIAMVDAELFGEIYDFAIKRYEEDKATYHVSAELCDAPDVDRGADILDDFTGRQILHVTFGSVLTDEEHGFRKRVLDTLEENPETYCKVLEKHISKHINLMLGKE